MSGHDAEEYLLSFARKRACRDSPFRREHTLERMQRFLDYLGNPERAIPHAIHVTGTSGKGSTSLFLGSIIFEAGYRVGCMTSPHPNYIGERWMIDMCPMTHTELGIFVERHRRTIDAYTRRLPETDRISFFELVTALGFLWFAERSVTWAIVEAGVGGRCDATNVLPHKDIAIITNLGLDHTKKLGNTIEKIAKEKCGIITPESLVFTRATQPSVRRIIGKAKTTPVHVTGEDFHGVQFSFKKKIYHIPVIGRHQAENAALAIEVAQSLGIPISTIRDGLSHVQLPLRMEVISKNPWIIIDGAHNNDKMKATVDSILAIGKGARVHVLLGFSTGRDTSSILRQIMRLAPASIACTRQTQNPYVRVVPPTHLAKKLDDLSLNIPIRSFARPDNALSWVKTQMKKGDILLVTGSMFLAGQLRLHWAKNYDHN